MALTLPNSGSVSPVLTANAAGSAGSDVLNVLAAGSFAFAAALPISLQVLNPEGPQTLATGTSFSANLVPGSSYQVIATGFSGTLTVSITGPQAVPVPASSTAVSSLPPLVFPPTVGVALQSLVLPGTYIVRVISDNPGDSGFLVQAKFLGPLTLIKGDAAGDSGFTVTASLA